MAAIHKVAVTRTFCMSLIIGSILLLQTTFMVSAQPVNDQEARRTDRAHIDETSFTAVHKRPGHRIRPIAPYPQSLIPKLGEFIIAADVVVVADLTNPDIKRLANDLADKFFNIQGFRLRVQDYRVERPAKRFVIIDNYAPALLGTEGYQLSVQTERIVIRANAAAGVYYALQTLYQMLPPELYLQRKVGRSIVWTVPACEIEDRPAYDYRGLHLDVSRHFFTPDEVKRYIYLMAMHKFNYFHWHLTDDQGWRIEIKSYPKLTTVGSKRTQTLIGRPGKHNKFDGVPHEGYYTHDEIRDIVRFAQEHYVTIIPEIDIPGHCQAAIAAYPELGCSGLPVQVGSVWGVSDGVLCPNEKTFQFLENVFAEVADLFPGPYIHIGGDEVPPQPWLNSQVAQNMMAALNAPGDVNKLQAEFNRFLATVLAKKGKKIIGWDEILDGPLPADAIIMSWRGFEGGERAARMHHQAIMSPVSHCYFDHYQNDPLEAPLAIGGYTTVEKVYSFNPRQVEPGLQHFIIGGQGNLWTEYIKDFNHLTYMAYPRAIALAEALWTAQPGLGFEDFLHRMVIHTRRLENMNINFAKDMFRRPLIIKPVVRGQPAYIEPLQTSLPGIVRVETGDQVLTSRSPQLDKWYINKPATLRFQVFEGERAMSSQWQIDVEPNLLAGLRPAAQPAPLMNYADISKLSDAVLLNYGTLEANYVVWPDTSLTLVYEFSSQPVAPGHVRWIYLHEPARGFVTPQRLAISTSEDGIRFSQIAVYEHTHSNDSPAIKSIEIPVSAPARFIKLTAEPLRICDGCPEKLFWALSEIQFSAD